MSSATAVTMRFHFALLLIVLTACLSTSQVRSGHQLGGYVREETSNTPIESVVLEILSSGQRAAPPAVSGTNGEFRFSALNDGDYNVVATKAGYDTTTMPVSIRSGTAAPVVVVLHKVEHLNDAQIPSSVTARDLGIPDKARQAFEKGRQLIYEKSDPRKAIEHLKLAIELFPNYYEAYTQIGVAYYRLNKFSDAERSLRKAVEISGEKYPEALYLLAAMFNDQERFADAEKPARMALAAGDSTWHGPYELARALVGLKRAAEAEASAVQARDLKPDNAQVYLVLANAHIQQQKFPAVVQDFDEFLKLTPSGPASDQIRQRRDRMRTALQRAASQQTPAPKK
jgi:tetratricopeptide (TPR) repeat protein